MNAVTIEPKLPRLTDQQSAFVSAFMRYGVASKAYRLAYKLKSTILDRTVWAEASRTLSNPKVSAWVEYLRHQAMHDSMESIMREFDQNRHGALADGNYSAANGATRGKAQVMGLIQTGNQGGGGMHVGTINFLIVKEDEAAF